MDDFSQTAGSPLACSAKPVLYFLWEMCTTLPTPFSMLCTIADASPTPHGDGNLYNRNDFLNGLDASHTPHGDGNFHSIPNRNRLFSDASPTPLGDGNVEMRRLEKIFGDASPTPSRGRQKRISRPLDREILFYTFDSNDDIFLRFNCGPLTGPQLFYCRDLCNENYFQKFFY